MDLFAVVADWNKTEKLSYDLQEVDTCFFSPNPLQLQNRRQHTNQAQARLSYGRKLAQNVILGNPAQTRLAQDHDHQSIH